MTTHAVHDLDKQYSWVQRCAQTIEDAVVQHANEMPNAGDILRSGGSLAVSAIPGGEIPKPLQPFKGYSLKASDSLGA